MSPFSLRRAQPTAHDLDLAAPLFDAYRRYYEQPADLPLARQFIADRLERGESVIYVAVANEGGTEQGLGFVQLYPSFSSVAAQPIWVLNDLFVASSARQGGVGRALMEAARRHALDTGARRLTLVTLTDNHAAQRLYESLGYVCENDVERHYVLEMNQPA